MSAAEPAWLQLLRRRAEATSNQAVSEIVGFSRTVISLVLNGKYGKSTDRLELAVLARLDFVDCPHLGRELTRAECDRFHRRSTPQSDVAALKHWVACSRCPVAAATRGQFGEAPRSETGRRLEHV